MIIESDMIVNDISVTLFDLTKKLDVETAQFFNSFFRQTIYKFSAKMQWYKILGP